MWCHLKNLAGVKDADRVIETELKRARIPAVKVDLSNGEVPYTLEGKLGEFRFQRVWTYWVVHGPMPLPVALELYEDPVGKDDIRVAGHCGCPPPEKPWVTWRDQDGKKRIPLSEKTKIDEYVAKGFIKLEQLENDRFVERPEDGWGFIESYHVDSEVGLRIFADAVQKVRMPLSV